MEHVHPLVRTQKQLDRVLTEIEEAPGIVLYTLLEENLVGRLEGKCRTLGGAWGPSLGLVMSPGPGLSGGRNDLIVWAPVHHQPSCFRRRGWYSSTR